MELKTLNHCIVELNSVEDNSLELQIYDLCSGQKTFLKLSNSNIIDLKCYLDKELLKKAVKNV